MTFRKCFGYSVIAMFFVLTSQRSVAQFYQGTNVEFGKNRVQYRDFQWFYYPGQHFDVYYYIGGEQMANYTLRSCENNLNRIQKFFDYALEDRIQVVTYLKQSEFRQNNIGISNDDQYNIGGTARIMGNKMFVYYEGSHASLERQVRENLSRVVFNQMMYGGDWKEVLKSSTLLSMPKWYEEGIIKYAANGQNREAEIFIKDLVLQGKLKSLNRLYGNDAALGGQAFWHYVAEVYGENVIPNIIYMSRISRNVESGFLFVLGISVDAVTKDFIQYYKDKYTRNQLEKIPGNAILPDAAASKAELRVWKKERKMMGDVKVKFRKKYAYSQFKVSPDNKYVAYVTNELGQYKIWLYNTETKKKKRILKKEYKIDRIVDESFPVLCWHPSSGVLTYIFERRGRTFIGNYNLEETKHVRKELFRIEKVIDMDYSRDGKKIIFSGVNRGHTDLYLYQVIGNNQEQLTNDVYDDLNPRFIDADERVIFASNRPDDTLRKEVPVDLYPLDKDIFIYDLNDRGGNLERVTTTPFQDEHHPSEYSPKHFTYLGNAQGVDNRYLATIDSTISAIDTTIHYRYYTQSSVLSDFTRSPKDYQFNEQNGAYSLVFSEKNKPVVYLGSSLTDRAVAMETPKGIDLNSSTEQPLAGNGVEIMQPSADTLKQAEVDIDNYVFEDERKNYSYEKESVRIEEVNASGTVAKQDSSATDFTLPKSRNYRLNFATDYVLTQASNSFTSAFYQSYTGPTSINPGISGLIKIGISDLFEDYKVIGGFRLSGNLQNNDYGVSFENLKSRWDKKMSFQRQSQIATDQFNLFRVNTHSFTYQLKYPLSELASVRFTGILRQDRLVQLSIDPVSLAQKNYNEYNCGLRIEYVFDNTINKGLNLYNGTRYKIWGERYQQPDKTDRRSDFNIVGFDFRHYQKLHRELIAAFRVAGASSFGYYKLVHYLGGVDNWLFQRIDNSIPIADNQNYSFQSFSGPMRGFYVNSRNGNSFAVANAEVRWPVFKYLLNKPIKSDFVENFQLITFFDAGTAWTGKNPYSEENSFNNTVVEQNPVTVTIKNNREPIIYGYGFGLRSRVLGYFIRADWAWGIDDGQRLDRVFYLSLNLDF